MLPAMYQILWLTLASIAYFCVTQAVADNGAHSMVHNNGKTELSQQEMSNTNQTTLAPGGGRESGGISFDDTSTSVVDNTTGSNGGMSLSASQAENSANGRQVPVDDVADDVHRLNADVSTTPSLLSSAETQVQLAKSVNQSSGEVSLSRHRPETGPPPGHGRQRPQPGLAPSETKPSSRRNGVPPLEMVLKTSKARTGVPDLDMLESPSKPRKGVPPPPDAETADGKTMEASTGGAEEEEDGGPHWDATQARAHTSLIIALVFGVSLVLCLGYFLFRRAADGWNHRHYRKMNFLVDGMYNL